MLLKTIALVYFGCKNSNYFNVIIVEASKAFKRLLGNRNDGIGVVGEPAAVEMVFLADKPGGVVF